MKLIVDYHTLSRVLQFERNVYLFVCCQKTIWYLFTHCYSYVGASTNALQIHDNTFCHVYLAQFQWDVVDHSMQRISLGTANSMGQGLSAKTLSSVIALASSCAFKPRTPFAVNFPQSNPPSPARNLPSCRLWNLETGSRIRWSST